MCERERSHDEPESRRRIQGPGLLFYKNSFSRRIAVVLSGGSASNDLTTFHLALPLKGPTDLPIATRGTNPPTQESLGGKPHPNPSTSHILPLHLSKLWPINFRLFQDFPAGNGTHKAEVMCSCVIWKFPWQNWKHSACLGMYPSTLGCIFKWWIPLFITLVSASLTCAQVLLM